MALCVAVRGGRQRKRKKRGRESEAVWLQSSNRQAIDGLQTSDIREEVLAHCVKY